MNQGRIAHTLKASSGFLGRCPVRIPLAHAVPFEVFRSARAIDDCEGLHFVFSLTVSIVDNSLHFVKNFSRFVLKGLATHVYNSLIFGHCHNHTIGFHGSLTGYCHEQNPRFNRERWIGYIKGENGPNGGAR